MFGKKKKGPTLKYVFSKLLIYLFVPVILIISLISFLRKKK